MREKKDAENITPAAKPVRILLSLGEISFLRIKNTKSAPIVVHKKIIDKPRIGYTYLGIISKTILS